MFALSYTLSAFRLRKFSTTTSKQLSTKRCSNVIVLCYFVQLKQRAQSLMRALARGLSRGSSTPVASRTTFFMTNVNGLQLLIINTKISILIDLGVLDLPLCKIKLSKFNKQRISETGY